MSKQEQFAVRTRTANATARGRARPWVIVITAAWAAMAGPSWAQGDADAPWQAEIEALRQEIRQANEWRRTFSKAHLAGYATASYVDPQTGNGSFTGTTFNPIFHYQYKDVLLLEAELATELQADGETEMGLEYLTLDLLLNDYMMLVAGKFMSPIGQFIQNFHPGWINKLPSAPVGFGMGEAAPTNDVGVQLRGGFPLGGMRANYAVYTANGPRLTLSPAGGMIEMIETRGQNQDIDGDKLIGARLGFLPLPRLELGVSAASGKASGTGALGGTGARDYDVTGADLGYQLDGLDLRAEYVKSELGAGPAGGIDPEAKTWKASFAQAAYRFTGTGWEGVVRYGKYDRPGSPATKQWAPGVNYWFAANLVAKLGYEANDTEGARDDDRVLLQMAYGF